MVEEGNDEELQTNVELRNRFQHLRRITRKQSPPHMRDHPGFETFPDVYSEFEDFYTRDQLHSLEKCFLLADHDRDGRLNPLELKYWMEKHNTPISNMHLKNILKLADSDNDGALNFREFLLLCKTIELKDVGNVGGGGSIFDCFGEDTLQDLESHEMVKKPGSFAELKAEVHTNVKYFEDRIAEELAGPKPHGDKGYLERVREINQTPEFNLLEFFKHLRHPPEELKETCSTDDKYEDEQPRPRRLATAYIVLDNNKGPRGQSQSSISTDASTTRRYSSLVDDTKVIIPVRSGSSHKFDEDYLSKDEVMPTGYRNSVLQPQEPSQVKIGPSDADKSEGTEIEKIEVTNEAEEVAEVKKAEERAARKSERIQTSYERFYGSNTKIKFIIPDLQEDFENLELNSPKSSRTEFL